MILCPVVKILTLAVERQSRASPAAKGPSWVMHSGISERRTRPFSEPRAVQEEGNVEMQVAWKA